MFYCSISKSRFLNLRKNKIDNTKLNLFQRKTWLALQKEKNEN